MESERQLEAARNEVLRKIGRNMLLFQQMEHLLKFLVVNGNVAGSISELKENQKKRNAAVKKQMMGHLVEQYVENTFSGQEETTEELIAPKETRITFGFRVECDADYYETPKQTLASIVADRNELIHHLLPRFKPNSMASCLETDQYLDQQREKLLPQLDMLKSMVSHFQELARLHSQELAQFFDSDEGKRLLNLLWLRASELVTLLADIAIQAARPDGWTVLSIASQILGQRAPQAIADAKQKYGYKKLKDLIVVQCLQAKLPDCSL